MYTVRWCDYLLCILFVEKHTLCLRVLSIVNTRLLSIIWFENTFSIYYLLFHLLNRIFHWAELFNFWKSSCLLFLSMDQGFDVESKKNYLTLNIKDFLLFVSKSFIPLQFTFESMIYFELIPISTWDLNHVLFIYLLIYFQLLQHHLLKWLFLLQLNCFHTFLQNHDFLQIVIFTLLQNHNFLQNKILVCVYF
jgi:hypothetical protein